MTLLQKRKLFMISINIQFSRNRRHLEFGGHLGSYINYYKTETNKTYVDKFIDNCKKLFYVDLKRFFSIISRPFWFFPPLLP